MPLASPPSAATEACVPRAEALRGHVGRERRLGASSSKAPTRAAAALPPQGAPTALMSSSGTRHAGESTDALRRGLG
eukprot:NODE_7062_length_464_cov_213.356968.p4 GENE.NODE_7062_length_464_cov_213.356968~~NODE_7062_length_464_cov_213.356968.p4  ORF type:complete len:77 (+),score=12.99 NODE_7062_length_464_cov_213.356968:134-364(+)